MQYTDKLFRMLKPISVISRSWETIIQLHKGICDNNISVIKSDWGHPEHNVLPPDLTKIETWSTYTPECVELVFYLVNDELYCDVKIYDGTSFGGHRTRRRFNAELKLNIDFIVNIAHLIEHDFDKYLSDEYERYLENQRLIWINNLKLQYIDQP